LADVFKLVNVPLKPALGSTLTVIVVADVVFELLEPLKFVAFNVTSNVSATRSSANVK